MKSLKRIRTWFHSEVSPLANNQQTILFVFLFTWNRKSVRIVLGVLGGVWIVDLSSTLWTSKSHHFKSRRCCWCREICHHCLCWRCSYLIMPLHKDSKLMPVNLGYFEHFSWRVVRSSTRLPGQTNRRGVLPANSSDRLPEIICVALVSRCLALFLFSFFSENH